MASWEYKISHLDTFRASSWQSMVPLYQHLLDEAGGAGWELVEVYARPGEVIFAIFKRPAAGPFTETTLSYSYETPQNQTNTQPGRFQHATPLNSVRVNKIDQGGVDRGSFLASLKANDQITMPDITWVISAVADGGSYIQYTIAPATQSGFLGIQNIAFRKYNPQLI